MLSRKMTWVIIASAIAVIALIFIQLSWINKSRSLMEQAFNHKVCMALCSTVEDYGGEEVPLGSRACSVTMENEETTVSSLQSASIVDDSTFHQSLASSLAFFNIDLDYELSVSQLAIEKEEEGIYQCSANPGLNIDEGEQFVSLEFAEQDQYILGQMGLMLWLSVIILLFICAVFIYSNWMLWREKQQAELNVDFFNNMAHEFRTPLTNIHLATRLLAKQKEASKQAEYTKIIERENKKLLEQVERILYLARIDDGECQLKTENVNLKNALESAIKDLDIQIKDKQAQINLSQIPEQLTLIADKLHLRNVFRNLIENSLKYSAANPILTISTEQTKQHLKLYFRDNGVGMSKKEQALVFNRFQRSVNGNLHDRKGFGLGLAYVNMIMKLHQGVVRVQSELNKGSSFELQFPRQTQLS